MTFLVPSDKIHIGRNAELDELNLLVVPDANHPYYF